MRRTTKASTSRKKSSPTRASDERPRKVALLLKPIDGILRVCTNDGAVVTNIIGFQTTKGRILDEDECGPRVKTSPIRRETLVRFVEEVDGVS